MQRRRRSNLMGRKMRRRLGKRSHLVLLTLKGRTLLRRVMSNRPPTFDSVRVGTTVLLCYLHQEEALWLLPTCLSGQGGALEASRCGRAGKHTDNR